MNRINPFLFRSLFFVLVSLISACKPSKQTSLTQIQTLDNPIDIPEETITGLLEKAIQQRSHADWFAANINGNVNIEGEENSFNGQIRIKNREEIWITVSKFGFEIARMKITQDSVFLNNKLQTKLLRSDFQFFENTVGVRLSLEMIQDILLGNYFLENSNERYFGKIFPEHYAFYSKKSQNQISYEFQLRKEDYKFQSLTMRDLKNRSIHAKYEDYTKLDSSLFPQKISVTMKEPLQMDLQLNYQKIQINTPQRMPFSLPE